MVCHQSGYYSFCSIVRKASFNCIHIAELNEALVCKCIHILVQVHGIIDVNWSIHLGLEVGTSTARIDSGGKVSGFM